MYYEISSNGKFAKSNSTYRFQKVFFHSYSVIFSQKFNLQFKIWINYRNHSLYFSICVIEFKSTDNSVFNNITSFIKEIKFSIF